MTRPEAVRLARELYASDAWNLTQIRDYIAEQGVFVSRETIHRWADETYNRRAGERNRHHRRASTPFRLARIADADAIKRRVATLHAAGMEISAVRIAISVDYGLQISAQSIRHILETGELPTRLSQIVRNRLAAA